jgi:hypothetical protein
LVCIALLDGAAKMMDTAPLAEPVILPQGYNGVSERAPWWCGGVHDISQHGTGFYGS